MPDFVVWALAAIGLGTMVGNILVFITRMLAEANDKGKTIELGSMIIAVVGTTISIAGLIYTINTVDSLQSRIVALEKTAQGVPRAGQ